MAETVKQWLILTSSKIGADEYYMEGITGRPYFETLEGCVKRHLELEEGQGLRLDERGDLNIVTIERLEQGEFLGKRKTLESIHVIRNVAHFDRPNLFLCNVGCETCVHHT